MLIDFIGIVTEVSFRSVLGAALEFVNQNEVEMSITDASAVTEFRISADAIRSFVASTPIITPNRKRVVVAPSSVGYGLARLFYSHRDPDSQDTFVVRTMSEAHRILGIENQEFVATSVRTVYAAPDAIHKRAGIG